MLKPTKGRVLVKPDASETVTESGLYIAKKNEDKPVIGVVVVGNETIPTGSRVLFSKYGYDEVLLDKEVHYVVSDTTILGIFI
jgi:co-chaperonin GroES (HSP10)